MSGKVGDVVARAQKGGPELVRRPTEGRRQVNGRNQGIHCAACAQTGGKVGFDCFGRICQKIVPRDKGGFRGGHHAISCSAGKQQGVGVEVRLHFDRIFDNPTHGNVRQIIRSGVKHELAGGAIAVLRQHLGVAQA